MTDVRPHSPPPTTMGRRRDDGDDDDDDDDDDDAGRRRGRDARRRVETETEDGDPRRDDDGARDRRRSARGGEESRKEDDANEEGELVGQIAPKDARETFEGATASGTGAARPTRTGGTYVPPFKLAQMMAEIRDTSSVEYQRASWDALKKSINGLVNKVNASNVQHIVPELFQENMVRGRGLFARSVMKSQMASPQFSGVFAALVAVVNTKFPEIGELVIKRCILQFRRAYKRNDKPVCVAATKFLAALINQQVRVLHDARVDCDFACVFD